VTAPQPTKEEKLDISRPIERTQGLSQHVGRNAIGDYIAAGLAWDDHPIKGIERTFAVNTRTCVFS
jgi:hypothetical protein